MNLTFKIGMPSLRAIFTVSAISLLLLNSSGCGTSSSTSSIDLGADLRANQAVDDVQVGLNRVGGTTAVSIAFWPGVASNGVGQNGSPQLESKKFSLVVLVGRGADFKSGSSRLSDSSGGTELFGSARTRSPDFTGQCADGRTVLRFDFAQNELDDPRNYAGESLYLNLDLVVPLSAETGQVAVTSLNSAPGAACNVPPEKSDSLSLVPRA